MIPHVSRLLELWRIAAHYRLDTLFPAEELPEKARHALGLIRMHPDQRTLKGMMENAGFQNCDYHNLTGGIVAVHRGFKL